MNRENMKGQLLNCCVYVEGSEWKDMLMLMRHDIIKLCIIKYKMIGISNNCY